MTATTLDIEILEALDLTPVCVMKNIHGEDPPPADLFAVGVNPLICCGAAPNPPEVYLCRSCWDLLNSPLTITYCGFCGKAYPFMHTIARVVWL